MYSTRMGNVFVSRMPECDASQQEGCDTCCDSRQLSCSWRQGSQGSQGSGCFLHTPCFLQEKRTQGHYHLIIKTRPHNQYKCHPSQGYQRMKPWRAGSITGYGLLQLLKYHEFLPFPPLPMQSPAISRECTSSGVLGEVDREVITSRL